MHKLLLADDSVTIQRVIELTFSGEDIEVVAVNDGEQAIARIPAERPDIVLADIGMPKKGGYDVAAFVKGRPEFEHIPVLLLAGAFEPVDQARAEQVRCDGVLIKPFEPRQVIERVRELLEGVKGTPAQATADVLRPVERLSPRPDPQPIAASPAAVPVPVPAPAPAPAPSHEPIAVAAAPADDAAPPFEADPELDDYFESLNTAFDSVGHATVSEAPEAPPVFVVEPPPPAPQGSNGAGHNRRRGDSLDDYFDRLSNAFEHAKPAGTPHRLPEVLDELVEEPRVPTVDALVSGHGSAETNGTRSQGHPTVPYVNGHAEGPRNPIVEALEAMLGGPEPAPAQPTLPGLPDVTPRNGAGGGTGRLDVADAITERVLDRLVPEITATVRRLVHEEVEKMRKHH
jgi:CheY-like chemotaxis protein